MNSSNNISTGCLRVSKPSIFIAGSLLQLRGFRTVFMINYYYITFPYSLISAWKSASFWQRCWCQYIPNLSNTLFIFGTLILNIKLFVSKLFVSRVSPSSRNTQYKRIKYAAFFHLLFIYLTFNYILKWNVHTILPFNTYFNKYSIFNSTYKIEKYLDNLTTCRNITRIGT